MQPMEVDVETGGGAGTTVLAPGQVQELRLLPIVPMRYTPILRSGFVDGPTNAAAQPFVYLVVLRFLLALAPLLVPLVWVVEMRGQVDDESTEQKRMSIIGFVIGAVIGASLRPALALYSVREGNPVCYCCQCCSTLTFYLGWAISDILQGLLLLVAKGGHQHWLVEVYTTLVLATAVMTFKHGYQLRSKIVGATTTPPPYTPVDPAPHTEPSVSAGAMSLTALEDPATSASDGRERPMVV